jgi:hypothetical protein
MAGIGHTEPLRGGLPVGEPWTEGFLKAIIDSIPSPMFVVDDDVRIASLNRAALALFKDPSTVLRSRAGDAIHCVHAAETPDGCGRSAACASCVVRASVGEAFDSRAVVRRGQKMTIAEGEDRTNVHFLVTASPLPIEAGRLVLLLLEDIGDLMEARGLLPICMHCGKIRDDKNYWTHVDQYFKKHLDLDFSHGLCDDCLRKHYPDPA